MNRRKFIQNNLLGVTSALTGSLLYCQERQGNSHSKQLQPLNKITIATGEIKAGDIHQHLRNLGKSWINPETTVDTFKSGNPDMVVKGIAVGWMSYFKDLKKAVDLGCNLFITHEPTFYDHRDNDESLFEFEIIKEKKEFIETHELSIIRCHDVWDLVPDIGVRDAWATFLGFTNEVQVSKDMVYPRFQKYCAAYTIPNVKAGILAQNIARKLLTFGEDAVLFVGPKEKIVNRVAIGTGAITPFLHMVRDLQADVAICSNDGMRFWRDAALAIDMDYPLIVVDHACSEEFGIRKLAEHVSETFPNIPVYHIPQNCMYTIVHA